MKIPDGFNLNFILRAYIPGLIFAFFSFPVFSFILKANKISADAGAEYIAIIAFFWAVLVSILNTKIYQLVEGRRFWPQRLKERRRKRWQKYIDKLKGQIATERGKKKEKQDILLTRELWFKLRQFPLDGQTSYYSYYPTWLGNVIHEYESYSNSRYGIDAVFFWYRIWLKLDEHTKNDLDKFEAKADMAVHASFTFFVLTVINLIALIVLFLFRDYDFLVNLAVKAGPSPPPPVSLLAILAAVSCVLGIGVYYLSISLHRIYGEFFKSVIDLNRDSLGNIFSASFSDEIKKDPKQLKRYLQYHRIKCTKTSCGHVNDAHLTECEKCKEPLPGIFKSSPS